MRWYTSMERSKKKAYWIPRPTTYLQDAQDISSSFIPVDGAREIARYVVGTRGADLRRLESRFLIMPNGQHLRRTHLGRIQVSKVAPGSQRNQFLIARRRESFTSFTFERGRLDG